MVALVNDSRNSYAPVGVPLTTRTEIRGLHRGLNAQDITLSDADFSEDDDEDMAEGRETAQAILDALKEMPDYDVDSTRTWWPYKDWNDLTQRVSDFADVEIGNEASQYLTYVPDKNSIFKVKIIGESMGMRREVNAECYLSSKDKKVRYIKWRED